MKPNKLQTNQLGHTIIFSNEVISFDLPHPEETELIIEIRDNESNESVERATYSIATLEVIRPGDTSTKLGGESQVCFLSGKQWSDKTKSQWCKEYGW